MANLYPTSISDHPDVPESEKQVFEKLKQLDDTYHVFHSLTWHEGRDGECDFIIFNELKGFISLEVKGGRIDFDGRSWRSVDGSGREHIIKNPVEQARRSMFAVKSIYEKKFGTAVPGTYSWGVCFFDGNWKEAHRTLDLSGSNVIDIRGMENPSAWMDNIFKENETRHGVKVLSAGDKRNLLSLFNRKLSIPMSIGRVIEEQQKRLALTDIIQDHLLDLFEDKNRIAFQGAAGTGKTWIAMKKAKRLAGAGKRVLFLCYNRTLSSFIKENLGENENIDVMTFHSFAQGVLRDYISGEIEACSCAEPFFSLIAALVETGKPSDPGEERAPSDKTLEHKINGVINLMKGLQPGTDYKGAVDAHTESIPKTLLDVVSLLLPGTDSEDDFFSERLPLAVETAFGAESIHLDKYIYDAVIVDEGQDFHKNWCDTLKLIFDRYRGRVVYIFYDDNQTIFTGQKNLPVTGLIANSGLGNHIFRLRDNLRNTQEIHDFAVERSGLGSTAKGAEVNGVPPVEENFKNGKSAAVYIASILEELVDDHGIAREQIILLSNRSIENSIFAEEKKAGDFTFVSTGEGKRGKSVRYRTIHQFKGLESDVVILLLHKTPEDSGERYLSDELLYVGFTRAKHLLYVVKVE